MPTPSVGELSGVVALSSRDVWVAGKQILHFDGSGWRAFQLPAPAGYRVSEPLLQADEVVNDLAASSPNDVWAAGALITDHGTNGLILHWDGARWRVEPTETLTTQWSSSFQAVKVRSATDAWVVGTRGSSPASLGGIPLAGYWNGSSWNLFPSPPEGLPIPSPPSGTLFDVALTGTSDVWVAGTDLAERGFIERWHGSEVTGLSPIEVVLHVANPPDFHSIGAASPDDVWAAGGDAIWNWDGRIWRVATRLGPGSSLLGITARAGEIWAVGSGPSGSILVEHYCPGGA